MKINKNDKEQGMMSNENFYGEIVCITFVFNHRKFHFNI